MKQLFIFLLVFPIIGFSQSDTTNVYPELFNYPDLNSDTIAKYISYYNEINQISKSDIPYDSLTDFQKYLIDNEMEFGFSPFNTEPIGCSWYCAASPSSVFASSELDSTSTINYRGDNIHDFDLSTAWIVNKYGYGIGENIIIEFDLTPRLKLTDIEIYNGYCKSEKLWKENSRVKALALSINNVFIGNLNLIDSYQVQKFKIGSFGSDLNKTLSIKIEIIEVYPGSKYKDTAISEINFNGTGDH